MDALTNVARSYLTATHYVRKDMERQLPPAILKQVNENGSRILILEKKVQTLIDRGTGDDTFSEDDDFVVLSDSDSTLSGEPEEYVPEGLCYQPSQYVESPEWPGYEPTQHASPPDWQLHPEDTPRGSMSPSFRE